MEDEEINDEGVSDGIDLSPYINVICMFYGPSIMPKGCILMTTKQIAEKVQELFPMEVPLLSVHKALKESGFHLTIVRSPGDFSFYWMLKEK
ncbi:hypothetical protein DF185_19950 [Marinifilum breve]|uniref:Uncharacterized protein n=1 Tax=Marinifilum breve TaxID=2184082 RepID=A0A2V3ZWG8_9BACT|nr:hypothetical protein [Marinifilum breve]PXX96916.1 hypothetical protein DF185_19950 [Marinifilum breve]